jgi:hypothetical protein
MDRKLQIADFRLRIGESEALPVSGCPFPVSGFGLGFSHLSALEAFEALRMMGEFAEKAG